LIFLVFSKGGVGSVGNDLTKARNNEGFGVTYSQKRELSRVLALPTAGK